DVEDKLAGLDRKAADGDVEALEWAGDLLYEVGRHDEALERYLHAAEAEESSGAFAKAYELLRVLDRSEEAELLRRYGLESGSRIATPWTHGDLVARLRQTEEWSPDKLCPYSWPRGGWAGVPRP